MSDEKRIEVARSILTSFLREALKDGRVDAAEKAKLEVLVRMLKVPQSCYDEALALARSTTTPDDAAGSVDWRRFFREVAARLMEVYAHDGKLEGIVSQMAGSLGLGAEFIADNHDYIFGGSPAGSVVDTGGADLDEKFRIHEREGVRFVEIHLQDDGCRTEAGALRYYLGDIEMESKAPSVGGFFKAAFTGETAFKPIYRGTGKIVLEPTLANYFRLELDGQSFILDQGAYWASDEGVEISAFRNKAASALFSGEGWFQTSVQGTGTVIVNAPGPVEILDLKNETLVVDGSFAIARSASLGFEVSRSSKSLWGSFTSGEGLVNTIRGTGRVYLAPIPNHNAMLQSVFLGAMTSRTSK